MQTIRCNPSKLTDVSCILATVDKLYLSKYVNFLGYIINDYFKRIIFTKDLYLMYLYMRVPG